MGDLLGNTRFVKLIAVGSLPLAEQICEALRQRQIAAVIINDEEIQALPPKQRYRAEPPPEPFRIEVPEQVIAEARAALNAFLDEMKRRGEAE